MTDLRKAAEQALSKLDYLWEIAIDERMGVDVLPEIKKLRQALAQPEQKSVWIGFTNEEVNQYVLLADFVRHIEAKLKEKNT